VGIWHTRFTNITHLQLLLSTPDVLFLSHMPYRYVYMSPASLQPGPSAPLHTLSLQQLQVLLLGPHSVTHDSPGPHSITHNGKGPHSVTHGPSQQQGLCPADMLALAVAAAAAAISRGGCVLVPVIAGEGGWHSCIWTQLLK
jgi:hypothetical protein